MQMRTNPEEDEGAATEEGTRTSEEGEGVREKERRGAAAAS